MQCYDLRYIQCYDARYIQCQKVKNVWNSAFLFYVLSWFIYLNSARIKKKTRRTTGDSIKGSARSVRGSNGLLNKILVLTMVVVPKVVMMTVMMMMLF